MAADTDDKIAAFIARWLGTPGGAERANYQLFLTEFAQALSLPIADPATGGVTGDYQFDAPRPARKTFCYGRA